MTFTSNRLADKAIAVLLTLVLLCTALPSQQESGYVLHVESDLVLVNVTVRDKSGNFVQGLKPENFTILEDNKPQKILSFDVENVDAAPPLDVTQAKPLPAIAPTMVPSASRRPGRNGGHSDYSTRARPVVRWSLMGDRRCWKWRCILSLFYQACILLGQH